MKLYIKPGACSLASHIVLQELGKPFSTEKVDTAAGKTASGVDFAAISPNGYVPALEIAPGTHLTEGAAILQYLADSNPGAGLAPAAGSVERARLNEVLTFISSELHKGFSPLFNPKVAGDVRDDFIAKLTKRLAHVEALLADGREFIAGKAFTIADAYLFTVANWAGFVKLSLDAFPRLKAYQARMAARPTVQAALKAEGLLAA